MGLSQEEFAYLMGISVATLRNWEQGRRKPEGPARVLLKVASLHPEVLLNIVRLAELNHFARSHSSPHRKFRPDE
jgi:transcriptional regulator with XRE-family HTH domain